MAIDGGGGCGPSGGCGAESAAASASREAEAARAAEAEKAAAEKAATEKAAAEKAAAEQAAAAAVTNAPAVQAAFGVSSFTPATTPPTGMPSLSPPSLSVSAFAAQIGQMKVDPDKARVAANREASLALAREIVQNRDRVCYTPEALEKKAQEYYDSRPKIGDPKNPDYVREAYRVGNGLGGPWNPNNTPRSSTRQPGPAPIPNMYQSPPRRTGR